MKTKLHLHLIISILVFLLILAGGTFVYHQIEGWNVLDSAYFVVVTVTTLGYGDVAPQTDTGKIFTMFFSFFGIAFALYFISMISGNLFSEHLNRKVGQIKREIVRKEEIEDSLVKKKKRVRKKKK